MTTHVVKSWPHLYEQILAGRKKHEIRKISDRDYRTGDEILLQEYDQEAGCFTGRQTLVRITYVTSNEYPCALSGGALGQDYCILSIELVSGDGH